VLPFLGTFDWSFVSDDWDFLYLVQEKISLGQMFTTNYEGVAQAGGSYRPMVRLFWQSMESVFGGSVAPYRIATLIMHVINVLFVFTLSKLLIKTTHTWKHFIAPLIFATSPILAESVLWVSVINDTLATTWALLALLITLISLDQKKSCQYKAAICSGVFFFFSLLTKELAVLLPVIIIAASVVKDKNTLMRSRLVDWGVRMGVLGVFGGLWLMLRYHAIGYTTESYAGAFSYHLVDWIDAGIGLFVQMFFAGHVRILLIQWLTDHVASIAMILLIVVCAFVWRKAKYNHDQSLISFAGYASMILAALVPVLQFGVNASSIFPTSEGARYSYFGLVFVALACAALCVALLNRYPSRFAQRAVFCVVVLVLGSAGAQYITQREHWDVAAALADEVRTDMIAYIDAHPETSGFVVLGLPDSYRGAFIFRNAFARSIALSRPDADVLVTKHRMVYEPGDVYAVTQSERSLGLFSINGGYRIIAQPIFASADYSHELVDPVFADRTIGNLPLGTGIQLTFSESFFETNQQKRIDALIWNGEQFESLPSIGTVQE
jgi:hypothetical protein